MSKEFALVVGIFLFLIALIAGFGFIALATGEIMLFIPAAIPLAILLFLIVEGLITVPQEKRFVVEILGKNCGTLKPGLQWICPFLMSIKRKDSIWAQAIELFPEEVKIDFIDGSATPRNVTAIVIVKSPDIPYDVPGIPSSTGKPETGIYRLSYFVDDGYLEARRLLENATRSYFNGLKLDDALTGGAAGFNLIDGRMPEDVVDGIQATLATWGLKLLKLIVEDFDLDEGIVEARDAVQRAQRRADAAKYEVLTRAQETIGAYIEMRAQATGKSVSEVQSEIFANPEEKKAVEDFVRKLINHQMSLDKGALTHVCVGDEDNDSFTQFISQIIAVWKSLPSPSSQE